MAGDAWQAAGDSDAAADHWRHAAESAGDFARMAATPYSENTYYSIPAMRRLGETTRAEELTQGLAGWLKDYASAHATIDYFATSLPNMLLFIDDPAVDRDREVAVIRTQLTELARNTVSVPATS